MFVILVSLTIPCFLFGQVEICNNGIDDDNDDLIDINDDDCKCEIVEPVSLIPNPSFEEMDCCPDSRSQLDCATDWIQASEPTTDFLHTCDWMGWDDFPPPQPFPDGEGILGFRDGRVRSNNPEEAFWKEYAGACLISPLLADSMYRFQFDIGFVDPDKSPPINISFFGTTNCDFLPFGVGDEEFGCPSNSPNWKKLGEVMVSGGEGDRWVNAFIDIVPKQDIYAIAIGPDCDPVPSDIGIYYFFDNLLLTDQEFFDLHIAENDHPCSPDFKLSVSNNPDFEYQWYLSGIALEGEVFSQLTQNYGVGAYQVRILNGSSCRVSATYEYEIPSYTSPSKVSICEGEVYEFGELQLTDSGSYLDTFQTSDGCDHILALELSVFGEKYDTIEVSILDGEVIEIGGATFQNEGEYPLTLTSSLGCDSLLLLKLSKFNVYIPNAFSPNNDGVNDTFYPFVSADEVISYDMQIFDRWGNLIFRGPEWDGFQVESGVYICVIDIQFKFGNSKVFYGSITLLK